MLRNMLGLQNATLLAQCDQLDHTDEALSEELSLPLVSPPQKLQGNIFYKVISDLPILFSKPALHPGHSILLVICTATL